MSAKPDVLVIVDDERDNVEKLKDLAMPIGYLKILTATSLGQALDIMALGQRVITDLMMSRGGIEGSILAKEYYKLGVDPKNIAIHSNSFTNNFPFSSNEKMLREVQNRMCPGVNLIPKWSRDKLNDFLGATE